MIVVETLAICVINTKNGSLFGPPIGTHNVLYVLYNSVSNFKEVLMSSVNPVAVAYLHLSLHTATGSSGKS
jgi:hypothetical protein